MYFLSVDYEEEKLKSYKGVCIGIYNDSKNEELVRSNTGDVGLDEKIALGMLFELIGKTRVVYSSSYDNYLMDFDERLTQIKKEVKKLFKGDRNLKKYEVLGDFISLNFKDVNQCPIGYEDIHTYIDNGLIKAGINLREEGLTICYCDGNYVSIQKHVEVLPEQKKYLNLNFHEPCDGNLYNKEVCINGD